jgi:hypothetical protein
MRIRSRAFASAGFLSMALAVSVHAGPVSIASGGVRPDVISFGHLQALREIREAVLQQQRLDGGTLTPAHLAKFQQRLDRSNEFYRRQLANNNPLNVNADGHSNAIRSDTDWTWSDLAVSGTEK